MSLRYTTVSFLSDYGLVDEFVGVVHSVIRSIAPDVRVIDVTHAIDAFDVRAGSLALARCAPYLAPGVVIAVVDPGVGSSRRAIAVEVGDGESVLIGPDNGVLAGAVALCGGVTAAIELTNRDVHLDSPGPTFAGRDVFAPVAAQLCLGVPLADLGTPIDPYSLTPGLLGVSHFEGDVLVAEVLWVDHYGNAQLNIDPDDIDSMGSRIRLRTERGEHRAVRAASFDAIGPGMVGLVVDSYGLVSIALDRASAAAMLGVRASDPVWLETIDDEPPTETVASVFVNLTPKGPQ
jgi:S-adenosylmethionine hydrolase